MNFSHLEMKSRSDSFVLGFGTGIKNHTGNSLSGKFKAWAPYGMQSTGPLLLLMLKFSFS
jgi:hypothetical protein